MKKIALSIILASQVTLFAGGNEELTQELKKLQTEFIEYKNTQTELSDALLEEILNQKESSFGDNVSSLGLSASKVYHSSSTVSLGGYGSYKYKKYTNFKNYADDLNNQTRRKTETNVVRFIPYIGYNYDDKIIMNTEIEFEDGGSRSDGSKNYKYVIVEFSYLDFLFDEKYNLRVGHVLVPFGNINLNHEPTVFLTAERPLVETFIIPSTWHTNGALVYGTYKDVDYYAGVVTSPDAGGFIEGKFIQQGRLGARQFTDDLSFVARGQYAYKMGIDFGGSIYFGKSSSLTQDKPGSPTNNPKADVTMAMAEVHASYKREGFNIQTLAVIGGLGGGYKDLNTDTNIISGAVNGQYITFGYDLLHNYKTSQKLYGVLDIERLDMDSDNETQYSDNYKFMEYSFGLAYFPDPKVVIKMEYATKDYNENAKLADESMFTATAGFIF